MDIFWDATPTHSILGDSKYWTGTGTNVWVKEHGHHGWDGVIDKDISRDKAAQACR
jgi:hypothetical protein